MWLVGIHNMVLRGMSHMQLLGLKTVALRFSKKKNCDFKTHVIHVCYEIGVFILLILSGEWSQIKTSTKL
jgi:hypothetical protein